MLIRGASVRCCGTTLYSKVLLAGGTTGASPKLADITSRVSRGSRVGRKDLRPAPAMRASCSGVRSSATDRSATRMRGKGSEGRWQPRTPAMAAGLADHVWSLDEWLTLPAVQR